MRSKQLLDQLLGGAGTNAALTGFLGGSLGGLLTSKKGRKGLKKAATYGGLAALGVMAYQAWQRSQAGEGASSPGAAGSRGPGQAIGNMLSGASGAAPTEDDARAASAARFLPPVEDDQGADDLAAHVVAAMISAARADGVLDAAEQQLIHAQLQEAELDATQKAHLLDLMHQPADPHRIAGLAGSPEEGAELYLASALAIEPDHWAEQAYLRELRNALGLDESLARELEATAAAQR